MQNRILCNGVVMPTVGLGTYPIIGDELVHVVDAAYRFGYRLIDTADNYYNEADLGHALSRIYSKGATRQEMFILTKISDELYHPNEIGEGCNKGKYFWKTSPIMQGKNTVHNVVRMKVEQSMKNLRTDYLDGLLMHWPYPDFFQEIWKEMEDLYREGIVRAIGVCNCRERHFEKLKQTSTISPMINQFETSPLNTKNKLVQYCKDNHIQVMVYSPLMSLRIGDYYRGDYTKVLKEISSQYGKSLSQILLKYDVQRGFIPIPKSLHEERLVQNISVFDFELSYYDMLLLNKMNINLQTLPESKSCPGL